MEPARGTDSTSVTRTRVTESKRESLPEPPSLLVCARDSTIWVPGASKPRAKSNQTHARARRDLLSCSRRLVPLPSPACAQARSQRISWPPDPGGFGLGSSPIWSRSTHRSGPGCAAVGAPRLQCEARYSAEVASFETSGIGSELRKQRARAAHESLDRELEVGEVDDDSASRGGPMS